MTAGVRNERGPGHSPAPGSEEETGAGRDATGRDAKAEDRNVPGEREAQGAREEQADGEAAVAGASPYSTRPPARTALSARELAVLALERRSWPAPGAKERAIREELGLAPVRYYQLLNALLDDQLALAHDPVTVNRLRRVREARRGER